MKQKDLERAWGSIAMLNRLKLPVKKAYAIYKLSKTITESCSWAAGEQAKRFEKYNGTINNEGVVTFLNESDCKACKKELDEISNMDVDIEITPVELSEDDLAGQTISPADIYNLEGFVTFV